MDDASVGAWGPRACCHTRVYGGGASKGATQRDGISLFHRSRRGSTELTGLPDRQRAGDRAGSHVTGR